MRPAGFRTRITGQDRAGHDTRFIAIYESHVTH